MSRAVPSDDECYRYWLEREIDPERDCTVMFVMLNPSTADEEQDDPTIRRCIGFARDWGCGRLIVTNLSPLRATNPKNLKAAGPDPPDVRKKNLEHVQCGAEAADKIVLAWGTHGRWEDRGGEMIETLRGWGYCLYTLGLTRYGWPRHPLPVPKGTKPIPFQRRPGRKTRMRPRRST